MTDIFDQAQAVEQRERDLLLKVQQQKAATLVRLTPNGKCHSPICGVAFDDDKPGRLFCGPACAQDHHKYQR